MIVLGIETACDDTAAAIVVDGRHILSNIIWTQTEVHSRFGGVVPELAARRHTEVLNYVIQEAVTKAGIELRQIEAIGVNCKHGLLRSIIPGVAAAKALAYGLSIPLIGVHHIEGHIYSNVVAHPEIPFPHLCLTVAGGHTLITEVLGHGHYRLLGRTIDDSAGEAFDKVARHLGLGFPGGKIIDDLAATGNPAAICFPRPLIDRPGYDFSFSGLKTAVQVFLSSMEKRGETVSLPDLAASFQQAVVDVLVEKVLRAARDTHSSAITVAGGVAANRCLRRQLGEAAGKYGIPVYYPSLDLCTDNGAMIACLAYYKLQRGQTSELNLEARANAPLVEELVSCER